MNPMRISRRSLAQCICASGLALVACEESTISGMPDSGGRSDAGAHVDAGADAGGSADAGPVADAGADAGPVADAVDYTPAPADGGACPLLRDIEFIVTEGFDRYFVYGLTLQAPATVWQYRAAHPGIVMCSYPAPACDDPVRPDFADLRKLLAHPEIVALLEQGFVSFGKNSQTNHIRDLEFGTHGVDQMTIEIIDEPPRCSALEEDDAGPYECVPDVVAQLFDLMEAFRALHVCEG